MKKKKCPHCKKLFQPDARNGSRQVFCCRIPECRKASKKDSQKRWLEKPSNQDYFRSTITRDRVKEWRKTHPGYWLRKSSKKSSPLQETITPEPVEIKTDTSRLVSGPLQEIIMAQPIIILGLIANLTGIALQDHISITVRHLLQLGLDITNQPSISKGEHHDIQTAHFSPKGPEDTPALQLAGPSPGP